MAKNINDFRDALSDLLLEYGATLEISKSKKLKGDIGYLIYCTINNKTEKYYSIGENSHVDYLDVENSKFLEED